MLLNQTIGNLTDFPINGREIHKVSLEWYELAKKRIRTTTDHGEEIGLAMEKPLENGDVLYQDEERIIAAEQLPCTLTVTPVDSMQKMGRLCFELGNRHLSLAIADDHVTVIYDEPTYLYLQKLGFAPEKKEGLFEHYTVCHGHGHAHEDGVEHGHEHTHANTAEHHAHSSETMHSPEAVHSHE